MKREHREQARGQNFLEDLSQIEMTVEEARQETDKMNGKKGWMVFTKNFLSSSKEVVELVEETYKLQLSPLQEVSS